LNKQIHTFLLILILIISLQSWTKADDIREFEIEGVSIEDSLLNYMQKEEIIELREKYYEDDTFSSITIFPGEYSFKLSFYDALVLSYKTKDKKFELKGISGIVRYKDNIEECYPKMKDVINDLTTVFPKITPTPIEKSEWALGSVNFSDFNFKRNDVVTVSCIKYNKGDHNYTDNLRVAVNTREFVEWLANKAYKK